MSVYIVSVMLCCLTHFCHEAAPLPSVLGDSDAAAVVAAAITCVYFNICINICLLCGFFSILFSRVVSYRNKHLKINLSYSHRFNMYDEKQVGFKMMC